MLKVAPLENQGMHLEGWHHHLNKNVGKSHPNFYVLFSKKMPALT